MALLFYVGRRVSVLADIEHDIVFAGGHAHTGVTFSVDPIPPRQDEYVVMWATDISRIDFTNSQISWTSEVASDVAAIAQVSYDGVVWVTPTNPGPLPAPGSHTRIMIRQRVTWSAANGQYVTLAALSISGGAEINIIELDLSCSEGTSSEATNSQRAGQMTLLWPMPKALYPVIEADIVPYIQLPVPPTWSTTSTGGVEVSAQLLSLPYDPRWVISMAWVGAATPTSDRVIARWGQASDLGFRIVLTSSGTARLDLSLAGTAYETTVQVPIAVPSPGVPQWTRFSFYQINSTQSQFNVETSLDGALWSASQSAVYTTSVIHPPANTGFEFVGSATTPIEILAGRLTDVSGIRRAEWAPSFSSFDRERFLPAWVVGATSTVDDLSDNIPVDVVAVNAKFYGGVLSSAGTQNLMSRSEGSSSWLLATNNFCPRFTITVSGVTIVNIVSTKPLWDWGVPVGVAINYKRIDSGHVQATFYKVLEGGAKTVHEVITVATSLTTADPPDYSTASVLSVGSSGISVDYADFRDDSDRQSLHFFRPPTVPVSSFMGTDDTTWALTVLGSAVFSAQDPEGNWWGGTAIQRTNSTSSIKVRLPRMDVSLPEINDDGNEITATYQLVDKTAALDKYKLVEGYQALGPQTQVNSDGSTTTLPGTNVSTHINALAALASVDLSWASLSISGNLILTEDHYFEPGTGALDVINQLLESLGNDHLSMAMGGADSQGIPLTSIFSGPAAPSYEPYMHFGPTHSNVMTKAQIPAPEVDLPNRITVIPESGSEDSEEGNGKRTVSNVDTGPLSIGLRGQIVPQVVTTKAATQAALDLYSGRLAIQAFQGGGDRVQLTTTLCPILSPDDVIAVQKPRLNIDGRYRITDWSARLTPTASEDGLTMTVNAMAVTNSAMIIVDKGVGTEGVTTVDAWRWDFSYWDIGDPWA